MSRAISRRRLMLEVLTAATALPALDLVADTSRAAGLTPLETTDAAASALGFVTQASAASSNPVYRKGQHCASCMHFRGKPSDATGGCDIYAGRSVPAEGWCIAWTLRSG